MCVHIYIEMNYLRNIIKRIKVITVNQVAPFLGKHFSNLPLEG